jgi:hypothetical protein
MVEMSWIRFSLADTKVGDRAILMLKASVDICIKSLMMFLLI